jgi:hypothetical protein
MKKSDAMEDSQNKNEQKQTKHPEHELMTHVMN